MKHKAKKTDNSNMAAKLALRKMLLDELDEDLRVIDCCAATGQLWRQLKKQYIIKKYVAFDIKPQMPGSIKMDSRDALRWMDTTPYNVIDIDTYGEPWAHLMAITSRIEHDTAVFLTHGHVPSTGAVTLSNVSKQLSGIPLEWDIPRNRNLPPFVASYCLTRCCEHCTILTSKVKYSPNVDYYGLILTKKGC